MEWMRVALLSRWEKAEPIQRRLCQAGFTARIAQKPSLRRLWLISAADAGARVRVPGDQFERAEQFLLDLDAAEDALHDAIRCPECKSLRVDYPQFARHSLLTNLGLGVMALLGIAERDYYCEDCHFTWPKEGSRPRRRPHMAPYYFIEGVEQTTRAEKAPHREAA